MTIALLRGNFNFFIPTNFVVLIFNLVTKLQSLISFYNRRFYSVFLIVMFSLHFFGSSVESIL